MFRDLGLALALAWSCAAPVRAASSPPNPPDPLLVIYVAGDPYGEALMQSVTTAFAAMTSTAGIQPVVSLLAVGSADSNGIYPKLQAAGLSLGSYCQVWDLRFNNAGGGCCTAFPPNSFDTLTLAPSGPNSDEDLYQQYLSQDGHLFVLGDNANFQSRNRNLIQFINNRLSSGNLGYPWFNFTASETFTVIDSSPPDNFGVNYATLGPVATVWPGKIIAGGAANQTAGGRVLVGQTVQADGNSYALALEWQPAQLNGGRGKLLALFDSNLIQARLSGWMALVQNAYTALAGCGGVELTKSVAPASACVGENVTYNICYRNTGRRSLANAQVWDTLPGCLGLGAATSPPPATVAGPLLGWNLGPLAPGATACISLVARVLRVPPCP